MNFTMRERLAILLKSEGLTSSKLAEILEVQPATISHILAGRNKPGFDFLARVMQCFPAISPDWLILGAEPMYRENSAEGAAHNPPPRDDSQPGLFDTDMSGNADFLPLETEQPLVSHINPAQISTEKISKIITFYEDRTFVEYNLRSD